MTQPQPSDPDAVSEQEADAIIERLQRDELSEQDKAVISKVIRSYLYLSQMVQQTGVRIKTVRQFLLGGLSKKKDNNSDTTANADTKGDDKTDAAANQARELERPLTTLPGDDKRKQPKREKPSPPGHGRLSASDYTGATHRPCSHPSHQAGELCPLCCAGRLYPYKTKQQIQLHGHAPVSEVDPYVETIIS